jgi:putative acetyltransferase
MTQSEIYIRPETPDDRATIFTLLVEAFGRDTEARLVELLRARNEAPIALVATLNNQVLGHIMFSPIHVANAFTDFRGIGLAPVAIIPTFQNQGIGLRLIRAGLEACRIAHYDIVVVLGHTSYYPRFGFSRAMDYGLLNEYDAQDAFMVLELKQGTLARIDGLVQYAPAFRELDWFAANAAL